MDIIIHRNEKNSAERGAHSRRASCYSLTHWMQPSTLSGERSSDTAEERASYYSLTGCSPAHSAGGERRSQMKRSTCPPSPATKKSYFYKKNWGEATRAKPPSVSKLIIELYAAIDHIVATSP